MRHLILITLCGSEEYARLGIQPEDYDMCKRQNMAIHKGLEQRLARLLTAGKNFNDIHGTEHTEFVKPRALSRTITPLVSNKNEAAKEAKRHIESPNNLSL